MAAYTQTEILNQLDCVAWEFTFPMLDNGYVALADTRLHAYRDNKSWAIIIETLGASNRAQGEDVFSNCLYCFGNCLNFPAGRPNADFLHPIENGNEGEWYDEEYAFYVREEARTLRIRDTIVPINLDPAFLAAKGIEAEKDGLYSGAALLRSLIPEYRDLLFAAETELRLHVPPDLPQILQLEEWHHPDVALEELPSSSSTFQMLADVLASGDVSRYQPTQSPNTHWHNWPEGGTI